VDLNHLSNHKMSDYLKAGEIWLEDENTGGLMICKDGEDNLNSFCPDGFKCMRRTNPG
jgi:hypothetical protein